jgi:phenylacetate-CoA ligase
MDVARKLGWTAWTLWAARAEPRLPYRSLDELRALQARRVRDIVRHAYRTVPFYREAMRGSGLEPEDVRDAADLARLPLVRKDDVTREPARFESSALADADGLEIQSSGTSGQSRTIRWDARGLFESLAAGRRQRIALVPFVGRESGYREMAIGRDGSVAIQMRQFYEERSVMPPRVELSRARLSPALPFAALLEGLNAFRPDVIRGYGSHLGMLLRWIHEGGRPFAPPRAVTYGADAMSDADRRLVEESMGLPVVGTYQAVEALRIGFQCEARRGYHLSLDQVAVRVVDGDGREVPPGTPGEIVISALTNRATVLLNYKLGDVVTMGSSACGCGRTLPVLDRLEGRADDAIRLADGTVVHGLALLAGLQRLPGLRRVQVVQETLTAFRVLLEAEAGRPELDAAVARAMTDVLGGAIAVSVQRVDAIPAEPGGKRRAVISRVSG